MLYAELMTHDCTIFLLSHPQLPLALDDFEPTQSWPLGDLCYQDDPTPAATPAVTPAVTPLQSTTTTASPLSAVKFEG